MEKEAPRKQQMEEKKSEEQRNGKTLERLAFRQAEEREEGAAEWERSC